MTNLIKKEVYVIIRPRVWLQLRVKRMMVPWTAILAQAPCGKVKRWGASVHVVVSFQLAAERLVLRSRDFWGFGAVVLGRLEPRPQGVRDEQLLPGWACLGDFRGAAWW